MEPKKDSEKEKEYHEEITDPNEKKILEDFKRCIATITDKKDREVLDIFVLSDNDLLIHFLRANKLDLKKATNMLQGYQLIESEINSIEKKKVITKGEKITNELTDGYVECEVLEVYERD